MRDTQHSLLRGLYLITPDVSDLGTLQAAVSPVLGAASVVQLRCKSESAAIRLAQAQWLRAASAECGVLMIVNDDVVLAHAVAADGVHLGREDGGIEAARAVLGAGAIIGASCYADFERARQAWDAGATYVAFGAVFASPTKPNAARAPLSLFGQARTAGMLSVAIGGITPETIGSVVEAGADMAAVISGIYEADDPVHAAAMCAAAFHPSEK